MSPTSNNLEDYPLPIRQSVDQIQQMVSNSQEMRTWKNYPLAQETLQLLETLPPRSAHHTPYDIIFLLDMVYQHISPSNTPRFAIRILEKIRELLPVVTPEDMEEYDHPLTMEDNERELQKWTEYIDTEKVPLEDWQKRYGVHLKSDPIERMPEWEELYYEVEKEVESAIPEDFPRGMGFCHMYWHTRRNILARKGIRWRSPAEMNPRVLFD